MKISGYVTDKLGNPIPDAQVELKNESFESVYITRSDINGFYSINASDDRFPFITAVSEYAEKYLEFWGHNIDLTRELNLNIKFDKIEIYGLNAFSVKGAYPALNVYFRPMSLEKFKCGDADIAPDIRTLRVMIDGVQTKVLNQSKVPEFIGNRNLTAFLLQVELPKGGYLWESLKIEITDTDENYGEAILFGN